LFVLVQRIVNYELNLQFCLLTKEERFINILSGEQLQLPGGSREVILLYIGVTIFGVYYVEK
jgi:hypothetical protein